jgi:hypothetical protein
VNFDREVCSWLLLRSTVTGAAAAGACFALKHCRQVGLQVAAMRMEMSEKTGS